MFGQGDMAGLPERQDGVFVDRTLLTAPTVGANFFVVSNLNLLRDGGYTFIVTGRNTTGAADSLWMVFNGDQTATNYQRNGISINASAPSYPTSNTFAYLILRENSDFVATFRIYPIGYIAQRIYGKFEIMSGQTSATARFDNIYQTWLRGSGENLTSIEVHTSNNILGFGARIIGKTGAW